MCEPTTMAVISVASAGMGIVGQRAAAKAQFAANKVQAEAQRRQIQDKATVTAGERVKQARAEQARLRVAAGEAGVAGQSFEAQLMDSAFQADQDIGFLGKDMRNQLDASQSRFLSANASVKNPSLLENGLSLGMSAASGYSLGQSLQIPKSTLPTPTD